MVYTNGAPGVYVNRREFGYVPQGAIQFGATHLVGSIAASSPTPPDVPTQVIDLKDFITKFGATNPNAKYVKTFFREKRGGVLFFTGISPAVAANPPTVADWTATISDAFSPELPAGVVVAPEAFQTMTTQADRTSVATAIQGLVSRPDFEWAGMIDSGPTLTINSAAAMRAERSLYSSGRGDLSYWGPHIESLDGEDIPSAIAVAAHYQRKIRDRGIGEPPGGTTYPLTSARDVMFRVTQAEQDVANPLGVNCIRRFPNAGVVVWGARTMSVSPYYTFVNGVTVLKVAAKQIEAAYQSQVFQSINGLGLVTARLIETANQIFLQLWGQGALYSESGLPSDAFLVYFDPRENPPSQIETGVLVISGYVVPAGTLERVYFNLARSSAGSIRLVLANQETEEITPVEEAEVA